MTDNDDLFGGAAAKRAAPASHRSYGSSLIWLSMAAVAVIGLSFVF